MKISDKNCFVCGNNNFVQVSNNYLKCSFCGHEINKDVRQQSLIMNDVLSERGISNLLPWDRFKLGVVKQCSIINDFLLDIGSASGKFLYNSKKLFKDYLGIEVSDECIDFAKNTLGLNIQKDVSGIKEPIAVATFWHSLEHIPVDNMEQILSTIYLRSSFNTRVIISTPNNESLQYRVFKERFAYYDPLHHIHQFSGRSLDKIMAKFGFEKVKIFYSFSYSFFGYLQGFLNIFNSIHDYSYYRLKRGKNLSKKRTNLLLCDLYNILLSILLILPSLFFNIYDFIFPEKGGAITVCYRRKKD